MSFWGWGLRLGGRRGGGAVATITVFDGAGSYAEMPPDNPNATDFGWTPSFSVYKTGDVFTTSADWDLDFQLDGTIYYVDPDHASASDANAGDDPALPLATLGAAFPKLGAGSNPNGATRIYADPRRYYGPNNLPADHRTAFRRNFELRPIPGREGRVQIIAANDPSSLTWTDNADGSYTVTLAAAARLPFDFGTLDARGMPTALVLRADAAAVVAGAAGGYWLDGNSITVKPYRAGTPDSDLIVTTVFDAISEIRSYYNFRVHLEDVDVFGYKWNVFPSSTGGFVYETNGANFLHKYVNCRFGYTISGNFAAGNSASSAGRWYLKDCISAYSVEDCFDYDYCRVFEENCIAYSAGWTGAAGSHQASTGHNGVNILRVGGEYGPAAAQAIADVTDTLAWNIGVTTVDDVLLISGAASRAWLEYCDLHSFSTEASAVSYVRGTTNTIGTEFGTAPVVF